MLNLPKNVYALSIVSGLCYSVTALMMLTGILVGYELTHDNFWSTAPIAALFFSIAFLSKTVSTLTYNIGIKKTFAWSILIALIGSCLAIYATINDDFTVFVIASICFGCNATANRQTRFTIVDSSATDKQKISALSLVASCSLVGAFIGPLIGSYGQNLIASSHNYSGSFILISIILLIALCILVMGYNSNDEIAHSDITPKHRHKQEPIGNVTLTSNFNLLKRPTFLLCVGSSSIAYFVMTIIACAAPIKMIHIDGHSLADTTLVIQTHLIAIFLPSIITASLIRSGLRVSLIAMGLIIYLVGCYMAIGSRDVLQYWTILLMLGFGWNFIYASTIALLPESYEPQDRHKAQILNDFTVHSFQGLGAIGAGWLLFNLQWVGIVLLTFALSLLWLICVASLHYRSNNPTSESINV